MANYLLMNKDKTLLSFSCSKNEFGETVVTEISRSSDILPIGLTDLQAFLEKRQAPKHRKHMEQLLERYGCLDLEGFLRMTHTLSLNDTFWVKPVGSGLRWAKVSLYTNPFDEVVAQTAFDGGGLGSSLSSTSPEFGTDGYYAKCWVRSGDEINLYKSGSDTYEIEPLSEFLATQVSAVVCKNAVAYDLKKYRNQLVSTCRLFTSEQSGLVKACDLPVSLKTFPEMLHYFESIGAGEDFRRMFILDALILNTDRHYGNFGVLFDTETMAITGMAPVYDNNRSLLFDVGTEVLVNPDWYIKRCRPRIGTDFIVTAKALMTDTIRRDVKALLDFEFAQHHTLQAEQERLDALSAIVRRQASEILA